MTSNSSELAYRLLGEHFGHSSFRGSQQEIITTLLNGESCVVIMPTGSGKSLCYQIPALALAGTEQPAAPPETGAPLTVVISPLIALMKDQVDSLQRRKIAATFINSSLSKNEREKRYADVSSGKYVLLYVTPERFRKPEFLAVLAKRNIRLLAVDEAHCISEWGHDFRPDYTKLGEIRRLVGNPVTVALTATATPDVQRDILSQLNLAPKTRIFHEGIDRLNLELRVEEVWDADEKQEAIADVLERWEDEPGSGIIYFTLIRTLAEFSERLQAAEIPHVCYHGDLDRRERRAIQDEFMSGTVRLVLATNAFGMGVDKEDIRFVVHAEVPGSMESYYQEIGRAGRDGKPAECTLLYDQRDLNTQMEFIRWSNPDAEFYERAWHLLTHSTEQIRAFGIDWLRERLCDRQRHDRRIETVLSLLQRYGVIDDEIDLSQLELNGELPEELRSESSRAAKLLRDQKRLYALVQYIQSEDRRNFIRQYFGCLEE